MVCVSTQQYVYQYSMCHAQGIHTLNNEHHAHSNIHCLLLRLWWEAWHLYLWTVILCAAPDYYSWVSLFANYCWDVALRLMRCFLNPSVQLWLLWFPRVVLLYKELQLYVTLYQQSITHSQILCFWCVDVRLLLGKQVQQPTYLTALSCDIDGCAHCCSLSRSQCTLCQRCLLVDFEMQATNLATPDLSTNSLLTRLRHQQTLRDLKMILFVSKINDWRYSRKS